MKTSLLALSCLATFGLAFPAEQQQHADRTLAKRAPVTVTAPAPDATYVGLSIAQVDQFQAIPFVQPPVGQLRFQRPQPLTNQSLGTVRADGWIGPTCPQNLISTDFAQGLPQAALGVLLQTPLFQHVAGVSEDCLQLNIYRPAGIDSSAKLPVLFWMHGGGFTMGFTMPEEGVPFVNDAINKGKPIIFVAVNYRVGAWGFLGGKEVAAAGVGNLGLLDQRVGMQWVADNIEAFGGDPDKVTIMGESAGAISVFDHIVAYDGDHRGKNGKPLFRGGVMNSGSIVPADPLACPKAQHVYDTIVERTGCEGHADTLQCLRDVDLQTLLEASTYLPTFLGYDSIALSFMPRPDGELMTKSPEFLLKEGKFARVPVIIGDEEDEGTLWSQFQGNLTTKADVAEYLNLKFFHHATREQMNEYVNTYQNIIEDGSPYRTGTAWNWYPQYKRVAAILGDLAFTLSRRYFLHERRAIAPELKSWSYLSSYWEGLPVLGSVHGGDIIRIMWGVPYDFATDTMRQYYLSFVTYGDPNVNNPKPNWPRWETSNKMLNVHAAFQAEVTDDFRTDSYKWIAEHVPELTM